MNPFVGLAIAVLVVAGAFFLLGVYLLFDRVFMWGCEHAKVRCVHGDEILFGTDGRRVRCLDCGRALDRPLPVVCSFTGQPH